MFWSLAPARVQAEPGYIHITGLVLLVLAGAKTREFYERHRLARLANAGVDYSTAITLTLLGFVAVGMLAFHLWGTTHSSTRRSASGILVRSAS